MESHQNFFDESWGGSMLRGYSTGHYGRLPILSVRFFPNSEILPYIGTRPSKKSIKRMVEAVHVQTARNMEWLDAEEMVTRLNQKLGGWANYFCLGPVTSTYRFIDRYTTTRLRRWLCKKHKQRSRSIKRYSDEYMYKHLRLIRLPMLPQSFPWAKA